MGEILVLAEHRKGQLHDVTYEMLTLANRLADENKADVTVVVLQDRGSGLQDMLKNACDRVLVMEDPELADYSADQYLLALAAVIKDRKPVLTLIGHTSAGMDLAPALASRMSAPLVTDCVEVWMTEMGLEVLRQIYGGKVNARLVMKPSDHYIVSIRTGTFSAEVDQGKSGDVEIIPAPGWEGLSGRRFIEYLEEEIKDVDITHADILVSIGRGIGKPDNIPVAQEFADAIGATLSCSRPVADKGWLPKSRQVGTSGKTVRPKIYIALGISGAFQHQAGMKNSDTIIAVNRDPKAPIFNIAHYGIMADLFQVLPLLTEKFTRKQE
jgi:electron transfer flavoprotein alpha subunit